MDKNKTKNTEMIEDFKSSQNQETITYASHTWGLEDSGDKWHVTQQVKEIDSKTKYMILGGVALAVVGAVAIIRHIVKD